MTNIENTLASKFGVKEVEHCITFGGVQYYTAVDTTFGDEVEIKVTGNGDVYTRIKIEGVDIDFENEAVSDIYVYRGKTSTEFIQVESAVDVIETEYKGIDLNAVERNVAIAAKYYISKGDSVEEAVRKAESYINYFGHTFRKFA